MFDIIVVSLSVIAFVNGLRKGFVNEMAGMAALVLGVMGAAKYSPLTEQILTPYLGGVPTRLVAFATTLLLIVFAVHALSKVLTKVLSRMALTVPNRIAGGLFSVAKLLFIISCLIGVLTRAWPHEDGFLTAEQREEMVTYDFVEGFSSFVFPYIDIIKEEIL